MSVTVLVPARAGSTRVPNKNIRELHGAPLAAWSLYQALVLPDVESVILSSDSVEYDQKLRQAVESHFGITADWRFVERDRSFSDSKATLFSYIVESWRSDFEMEESDLLVSFLPTAPLRRRETVQTALDLALASQRGVFTAVPYEFPVSFAFVSGGEGEWSPLDAQSPMITGNTRSQDQVRALHPNGGLTCMWGRDLALRPPTFYIDSLCVEASIIESADIDTEEDLNRLSRNFGDLWDRAWGDPR